MPFTSRADFARLASIKSGYVRNVTLREGSFRNERPSKSTKGDFQIDPLIWKPPLAVNYTLLPLHFSFCLTTLKNETFGITASGNVFFAFRISTSDPTSTCIGSRPSTLRYTG